MATRKCQNKTVEEDWLQIWKAPCFTSSVLTIRFQAVKFALRWYLTPAHLFKMKKLPNSYCWKDCGLLRDYMHVWWECVEIKTFWTQILHSITGCTLPLHPKTILLNWWSEEPVTKMTAETVLLLLAVA